LSCLMVVLCDGCPVWRFPVWSLSFLMFVPFDGCPVWCLSCLVLSYLMVVLSDGCSVWQLSCLVVILSDAFPFWSWSLLLQFEYLFCLNPTMSDA
jgi:hypothetical protein